MFRDISEFAAARRVGALPALGFNEAAIQRIESCWGRELAFCDREANAVRRIGRNYSLCLRAFWKKMGARTRVANILARGAYCTPEEVAVAITSRYDFGFAPGLGKVTLDDIKGLVGLPMERDISPQERAAQRLTKKLAGFTTEQLLAEIDRRQR